VLTLREVEVSYGKIDVIRGLDFEVARGEIVTMLGPNGSGKSTILKAIAGLVVPRHGSVEFNGRDITAASIRTRVRLGISLVPQGRRLFGSLKVEDNIRLGAFARGDRSAIKQDLEDVLSFFPTLRDLKSRRAADLSGGEQQMVAIARGLMARPQIILLDEPSLGLAPVVTGQFGPLIKRLSVDRNLSVILVEQNVALGLLVADRVLVLSQGRIALSDTPANVAKGSELAEIYFGSGKVGLVPDDKLT
jgi:branched-chain amino acid transport system ATP-binding protein